jgi:type II secretion system protein N
VRRPNLDWKRLKPRLAYGAFLAVAFLVALRLTFPSDAVKTRLIAEAGARGWTFDATDVGPAGVLGFSAEGVRLDDQAGLTIPIDRLSASLQILPLLLGKQRLDLDAHVFDGRVRGTADVGGDGDRLYRFRLDGVDLARAVPLRTRTKLELVGLVDGTVDVTFPAGAEAQPTGKVELAIASAGVNGGQLALPGMTSGFAVPKVALGEVAAVLTLAGGKGTFDRFEARGGDAELSTEGLYFAVHPKLEHSALYGKAKVRLKDALWAKPEAASYKGIAEAALASSRGTDGAYGFQVYGSLARPQMRPQK